MCSEQVDNGSRVSGGEQLAILNLFVVLAFPEGLLGPACIFVIPGWHAIKAARSCSRARGSRRHQHECVRGCGGTCSKAMVSLTYVCVLFTHHCSSSDDWPSIPW